MWLRGALGVEVRRKEIVVVNCLSVENLYESSLFEQVKITK